MAAKLLIGIICTMTGIWIGEAFLAETKVVEKKLPFLDLTVSSNCKKDEPKANCLCLECRFRIVANILGKSLESKEERNKLHKKNKEEAEKLEHYWYRRGYIEGYGEGVKDGRGR